jgi:glutathione S-transferase
MITLFTFGPAFGLPDPSPFVTKAETLLKMSGLAYKTDTHGFRKAPKGKLPYIDDDGLIIADSTFIRLHLEQVHKIDFDARLSPADRGIAWAFEKLCEDNLYWAMVDSRWMVDANFNNGPRKFFDNVPAPLRPLVVPMIRRKIRNYLYCHGLGRHSRSDIERLANRGIKAIADQLGDKPYFMGGEPCGADATIFSFVAGFLSRFFDSPIRIATEKHANLVAYCERMMGRYYPAIAKGPARPPELSVR